MLKKTTIGLLIIGLISSTFLLTSCGPSKKEIIAQQEAEARAKAEAEKEAAAARARAEAEAEAAAARARAEREAAAAAARAKEEAEAAARKALMDMESEKIYFDYDRSDLKPEARAVLTKKAAWLRENTEYSIKIEGHCDERGSTEYNLALGERRADAAAKFLSALGVSSSRISTVSMGEENPVDSRSNETAWAKNRRDEFILIK